jgi:hypothetical protein
MTLAPAFAAFPAGTADAALLEAAAAGLYETGAEADFVEDVTGALAK